ncbi:MAG TPA: helix-turn-helix transcriptional regulator [Bacillaceae bacterium]
MDVGKRIRELREKRGMEQIELAKRINISQSKMNKIETGFQKRIEPEILVALSEVFNVKVDYIVGKSDNPYSLEEAEFENFINDPSLERWYKELPKSKEEDLRKLRKMWEIIKNEE